MKTLLIFGPFVYIWFTDSENLFYSERKNDKVLAFNIVHFPNFKISDSLKLAPPSYKRRTSEILNLISAGSAYWRKHGK